MALGVSCARTDSLWIVVWERASEVAGLSNVRGGCLGASHVTVARLDCYRGEHGPEVAPIRHVGSTQEASRSTTSREGKTRRSKSLP
jgi:hypothetical protein